MSDIQCFHFGWRSCGGHGLQKRDDFSAQRGELPYDFPVSMAALDGGLMPQAGVQTEGVAVLVHFHCPSWTIIMFWDRSGDKRGNSNSSFIHRGVLTFEEIVEAAKAAFPKIWERFTFNVTLNKDDISDSRIEARQAA